MGVNGLGGFPEIWEVLVGKGLVDILEGIVLSRRGKTF